MKIGTALKIIREHYGLSQVALSRKSKLSQTAISQFENGEKIPSSKSIAKICKTLRIPESVVYLLAMEEDDVPKARRELFYQLYPKIKDLSLQILGEKLSTLITK